MEVVVQALPVVETAGRQEMQTPEDVALMLERDPTAACRTSATRCTTARLSLPPAGAFACTANAPTSRRLLPVSA